MCEITEGFVKEGIEIGAKMKAKETALNLAKKGIAAEEIAEIVNESITHVKQWLEGAALAK